MPQINGRCINSRPLDEREDSEPLIENDPIPPQCCSVRLSLAVLMFFGFSVVYALRVNFSVAMVAMVNTTASKPAPNSSVVHTCPPLPDEVNTTFQQLDGVPQYPWDLETQGWLLGAFFFGYLCTQIPGGYFSDHYGGSLFLGLGVLSTAVLTMLTAAAAQLGSYWLFALRVLEGIGEGVTFPAMMAMWARWAPPLERSRLMTISGQGSNFGAFFALPLTGYICQTLGWPAVFYICGGVGCLWVVLWFSLVSDDPRTHRRISEEEKNYIVNSIGPQGQGHSWSVPIIPMILSIHLWAIIISQMCFNWSYYTLLTSLPTYMDNILHFDLKSNGFLSALPYLGACLVASASGFVADFVIARRVFSLTVTRKIFTLAAMLPSAAFLLAVNYVGCNHTLVITFLTLSTGLGGIASCGIYINQIDIAPRYAGFLLGITNTFGTIPGVLAPIVTGYLTEDHSLEGWRKVFWLAAGISLFGSLFYSIFGSAKMQPWAMTEEEREEAEQKRIRSAST